MSKKDNNTTTNTHVSSYIDQFEQTGAVLTNPHLNEGNYAGTLNELSTRIIPFIYKKGDHIGEDGVMVTWGAKVSLQSETAQQVLKRDNDVQVYADQDTVCLGKGILNVGEFGITYTDNLAFFSFIGGIFEQVGLAAKVTDDSGAKTYTFPRHILLDIYKGVDDYKLELESNPEVKPLEIPGKLAEYEMKNINELICSESDTKRVYVHIGVRGKRTDSSVKEHFIKNIMLPSVFEAREANVASVIR